MKHLSLALCTTMLISLASNAQIAPQDAWSEPGDTLLSFTQTVSADGVSKSDLFLRARDLLNRNFHDLKIQDKETGEVSANGTTDATFDFHFLGKHTGVATFDFVITFMVKDGGYQFTISNIRNSKIDQTASNGTFGMLYNSGHSYTKQIILSQSKLDEMYRSVKQGFIKEKDAMVSFIESDIQKPTAF